jgi:integration host factor subunit beta
VTKKEIVRTISDKTGLPQIQIKEIVELTFEGIVETLLDVGRVELRNFGVFQVKTRKARKARNPRTGREVAVPEKPVVTFKPGKEMEARVKLADEQGLVERLRGMLEEELSCELDELEEEPKEEPKEVSPPGTTE